MSIKKINVGAVQNDGTGDPLRDAFVKVNENFEELEGSVGSVSAANAAALRDRATHTGQQAIGTVAGLQSALDARILASAKGSANGVASLDAGGKVPESQLPAIAITDVFTVASQAAMLALTAERGDVAVRSDLNKTFALGAEPASALANWIELRTPTDAVLSVAGKTGAVTLAKVDVGLGSVDDTADSAKPVSTAQQAALDAKVSMAGDTMTGPLTVPSLNGGQFSGLRNLLINGTMRTNQRGVPSLTNPASGAFLMDRWHLVYNGSGAARVWSHMAITPGDEVLTGGNIFHTRVEQTSSGAGATYLFLTQRIEFAQTLNGRKATVSFYARRVAGAGTTIGGRFRQFFNGSTAVDTYFPQPTITGSWGRYSFTVDVPSVAGKTIGTGNYLEFSLALPFNQAFTIDITGVQVEGGTSASPFEDVSQGLELMLCQRYYERLTSDILTGAQAGSQSIGSRVFYKVSKRTSGTVTANRTYTFNATPSSKVSAATPDGVLIFATSAAAGSLQATDVVAVDAEL